MELDYTDRCHFISSHVECGRNIHYMNYLKFIFCTVGATNMHDYIGGFFIVCIMCVYLFITLGTTADKFFCPALAVISKLLGLSENLGGVTLLAFGNGSPDIFTSLLNTHGDTELMYTQLIGGAAFVTGFVIGAIMIMRPFKLEWKTYVRDVLFFTFAAIYIHSSIHDQLYEIYEGFLTVGIYLVYLTVVIIEHFIHKRTLKKLKESSSRSSSAEIEEDILKKLAELEVLSEIQIRNRKNSSVIFTEEMTAALRKEFGENRNESLFQKFIRAINPLDKRSWNESNCLGKFFMIIKAPILFILTLIIPVVDYSEELHGWSKLLNMLNIIILPQMILLSIHQFTYMIYGYVSLALLIFIISIAIDIAVYMTSRNDCPPKYHVAFAVGSFAGSILVIYNVAKEVVSVMTTVGIISDLTDSMVGLSILAWGNSVGDVFANIALAKQGYQQMAFAACFGGPMFNSLLGIGLTFIIKGIRSDNNLAHTREGAMGPNCILFLVLILLFTLFALLCTDFVCRRSIGCFCIAMYVIFLLYCFLGEFEVMHPYGTDHGMT
ncbi:mitochondrial sodium/calcium exchanger protein-like [Chironomus tepperi]|uniref:mitochondrial sodium/calcium exchanger protein-like n=1 Tax=Chironomus tepperi TaxID=113505 RepID=UPI00391F0DBA